MLVGSIERCYKMVFERVNGTFSHISSVDPRWGELEVHSFVVKKIDEGGRCLIVQKIVMSRVLWRQGVCERAYTQG